MAKYTKLEFFSQERIALNKEVLNHPNLQQLLASYPPNDFENRLAEIAAYCGVVVDGYYTPMELDNLCKILYFRLQEKRMVYIEVPRNDQPEKESEEKECRQEDRGRDSREASCKSSQENSYKGSGTSGNTETASKGHRGVPKEGRSDSSNSN